MSKKADRTRIEFSGLELGVIEDALASYKYDVAEEVELAEGQADLILPAIERRKALGNALDKVSRARNRTGIS